MSPTRIRVSDPTELLSLVPYLMGFHVHDGVVVLVVDHGAVEVTIRLDHEMLDEPDAVLDRIHSVAQHLEAPRVFLAGYGPDRERAEGSLALIETSLDQAAIIDSVYTDGVRWWSRTCVQDCCPVEGTPCDPATAAAARAVLAGCNALASRGDLEAIVEGPSLFDQAGMLAELSDLHQRVGVMSPPQRQTRVRALVRRGLNDPLDSGEVCELSVLVGTVAPRDTAWLMMTRRRASKHLRLWQQVVAHALDADASAPLCLLAAAAWLEGNGALMGCALERARGIDPDYSMLALLDEIHVCAVHPSMWSQVRSSVAA